jgi:hypothetical protein
MMSENDRSGRENRAAISAGAVGSTAGISILWQVDIDNIARFSREYRKTFRGCLIHTHLKSQV